MQKRSRFRRGYLYTKFFGLRLEPDLKTDIETLSARWDMPEIIRDAIRAAVKQVKEDDKQAS